MYAFIDYHVNISHYVERIQKRNETIILYLSHINFEEQLSLFISTNFDSSLLRYRWNLTAVGASVGEFISNWMLFGNKQLFQSNSVWAFSKIMLSSLLLCLQLQLLLIAAIEAEPEIATYYDCTKSNHSSKNIFVAFEWKSLGISFSYFASFIIANQENSLCHWTVPGNIIRAALCYKANR